MSTNLTLVDPHARPSTSGPHATAWGIAPLLNGDPMIHPEIDLGTRCATHIGEVFAVRCSACDAATLDASENRLAYRLGFIPGTSCPTHPDRGPLPCSICSRHEGGAQ